LAYRVANAQAYWTIFLASFAFGALGMILAWFVAQNDKSKENVVAGIIHSTADEKALETEEG
jgi:ABC-type Mn2+/Zn2+ transport system permease subunit